MANFTNAVKIIFLFDKLILHAAKKFKMDGRGSIGNLTTSNGIVML